MRYLLDTNAYFAILKYLAENNRNNAKIENILKEECYISQLTQIEIISVIGQYARGHSKQVQTCHRIHADTQEPCGATFVEAKRKKWSKQMIHDWMKLEKEISTGVNPLFTVEVLQVDEHVWDEAQKFIRRALVNSFKSMDSMILGTAKAYSKEDDEMVVVTADRGLQAGMRAIDYPYETLL